MALASKINEIYINWFWSNWIIFNGKDKSGFLCISASDGLLYFFPKLTGIC